MEIEKFLFWYLDSFDDFYFRRFNGRTVDPEYVSKVKKTMVMQVCAFVRWVVCVCVCVCGVKANKTWEPGRVGTFI